MSDAANPVEAIFSEAVCHSDAAQRAAFLDVACGKDVQLRTKVDALLKAHNEAGTFMARSDDPSVVDTLAIGGSHRFAPAEKPGAVIGHYKLLQRIGEGGFGVVWMADQEKPVRRRVALKIIKAGMDTHQVIARFEQERQALAMMDHPNIARVLDAGATETGRPYFVMELVRGVKITEYCDQQNLSTNERIKLFVTVCQAVQHAHQKGTIHRDLKPSNILVTVNDGEAVPKVIDFGVAKATQGRLTDGTLFTQFEQMIGTPLYMSPEQAEVTSLDVDTRSDIYSLGVLLYELLTGRTPIDTATMAKAGMDEVRRLIREVDPPRPSARLKTLEGKELTTVAKRRHAEPTKLPGTLRGEIDWIVMKCLEKDRKRRYDTANGLALDLQRHLDNDVVIARPPTTAYLLSKLVRRNKVACVAGAAILVSLVIGIAASLWQAVRADREAVRARAAEQTAVTTLDELRATAPAFAEQARALAAKEQFDQAIQKLDYAMKLRPDAAEYLIAKADLLQCQFKLSEAATVYRQALALNPDLGRADASAKLCDELRAAPKNADGKLSRESLAKLHLAMQQQQRPAAEIMPVARLLGEEKRLVVQYWLTRLKDLPVSAERPLKDRLAVRDDGRLALDLSNTQVIDLTPLAGAPLATLNVSNSKELKDLSALHGFDLVELNINETGVTDLAPLRDMHTLERLEMSDTKVADLSALNTLRLRALVLRGCPVRDLKALTKMPLEEINLRKTQVADLSPLVGSPIRSIDLSNAPVINFAPLGQLPLEKCYLEHCQIDDLSILRDKPLKELVLLGCSKARQYASLQEIKTLELLLLDTWYRNLPAEEYHAIGGLRGHPKLRQLGAGVFDPIDNSQNGFRSTIKVEYAATESVEDFWQDWDRDQVYLPALRKSGIKFNLHRHRGGRDHLELYHQPLSDLSILKGAPISMLTMVDCSFSDLTPLHDLKIKLLELKSDLVTDLSPLRGMPLETLSLTGKGFRDLSPLVGLPITSLYVEACPNVTDVSPLAQIPTLANATVPEAARNIDQLRKLTGLERIAFRRMKVNVDLWLPDTSAAEFWKDFDQPWAEALRSAGIEFTMAPADESTPAIVAPSKGSKTKTKKAAPKAETPKTGLWRVTIVSKSFKDCSIFKGVDKIRELDLSGTSVADLEPLRGLQLTRLILTDTQVANLGPLAGMPLMELRVKRTNVADISALRGMPLTTLDAASAPIVDLEPLRGASLRLLHIQVTKVTDLAPLEGMPLEQLQMSNTKVKDLKALKGMPLTSLTLHSCTEISDVSPLAECKALTELTLPPSARDVDLFRSFTRLQRISFTMDPKTYVPKQTKAQFWQEYDGQGWQRKLRESGVAIKTLKQLPDGTWNVDLSNSKVADLTMLKGAPIGSLSVAKTAVADLSPLQGMPLKTLKLDATLVADLAPLKGMPLEELVIVGTKVADLSPLRGAPLKVLQAGNTGVTDLEPLRGMKLKNLRIFNNEVTDLTPLKGMEIELLNLSGTSVSDLSPLRGMPLTSVRLHTCRELTDLSPLADAIELQELTLSPKAKDFDFLRKLPKLKYLSFTETPSAPRRPDQTAVEFWKAYDEKKKPAADQ